MLKLHELRNPRRLRWPIYFFFGIIIVSFIFFYGWKGSDTGEMGPQHFARVRSDSVNPFKRWDYIDQNTMVLAERRLREEKLSLLPQFMSQMLMQDRMMERMITLPETAEEAANMKLLRRAADDMGVRVTDEQIRIFLAQQPGLNMQQLQAYASGLGMNVPQFIAIQREARAMNVTQLVKGLVAQASLFELWQEFGIANDQLSLQLAAFPVDAFAARAEVTDQELADYLEKNRDRYRVEPRRRYAYVKIGRTDLETEVEPSDEQLQDYYQRNQARYEQPEGVHVREIYVLVRDDLSTTAVQAILADARTSATLATDWREFVIQLNERYPELQAYFREPGGFLSATSATRPPEYLQQVLPLQADQVSSPIVTGIGSPVAQPSVYLVQVLERRAAGVSPLAEVREQVRGDYVRAEVDTLLGVKRQQILDELKKKPTLPELAAALGVEDQVTTAVEQFADEIPQLGSTRDFLDHVANLPEGELSDVLDLSGGAGLAVVQVAEEIPAHDPSLDEVRDSVEAAVRRERAVDIARNAAQQALTLVQQGADFTAATADATIKVDRTQPFARTAPVPALDFPLLGFTQQSLGIDAGSTGLSPYGFQEESPEGFAIWRLVELRPATIEEFRDQRAQFQRQYLEIQRMALVREWLRDLRRQADYEYLQAAR